MNTKQALTEARKRWGKTATVEKRSRKRMIGPYVVGRVALGCLFDVKGYGETWPAAFEYADQDEQHWRERYAEIETERQQQ